MVIGHALFLEFSLLMCRFCHDEIVATNQEISMIELLTIMHTHAHNVVLYLELNTCPIVMAS